MTTITFDKSAKSFMWRVVTENMGVQNMYCPFCNKKVKQYNWGGAVAIKGRPVLVDDSLPCLLALNDELAAQGITTPKSKENNES